MLSSLLSSCPRSIFLRASVCTRVVILDHIDPPQSFRRFEQSPSSSGSGELGSSESLIGGNGLVTRNLPASPLVNQLESRIASNGVGGRET